jgi:pyruvate carboxylase
VHAEDDGAWIRRDYDCVAHALTGSGPAAYLDREQLVRTAVEHRVDMVHPGCGFLSEDQDSAAALHGPRGTAARARLDVAGHAIAAPTAGVVASVPQSGTIVHVGGEAALIEAMKMEHAVTSLVTGVIQATLGDAVAEG